MKKLFLLVLFLGGCDTVIMQYPEDEDSDTSSDSFDGDSSSSDSVTTDSDTSSDVPDDTSSSVETQTASNTTETETAETDSQTDSQTVDTDSEPCVEGSITCMELSKGVTALVKCNEWGVYELVEHCALCDPIKLRCYECIDGEEDCYRVCMNGFWKIRRDVGYPAVCPDGFSCKYKPNGDMYCDPN
jgi:hypothetical protein